jgi:hypothetical protein
MIVVNFFTIRQICGMSGKYFRPGFIEITLFSPKGSLHHPASICKWKFVSTNNHTFLSLRTRITLASRNVKVWKKI